LTELSIESSDVSAADLLRMRELGQVRRLSFEATHLTAEALRSLPRLEWLEELRLMQVDFDEQTGDDVGDHDDATVQPGSIGAAKEEKSMRRPIWSPIRECKRLRTLVFHAKLTSRGDLAWLSDFTQLQKLDLSGLEFSANDRSDK